MLNRLIIAVFGLSLVFALGSVALAGPGDLTSSGLEERVTFLPNAPKQIDAAAMDVRPVQPSFKKPASALRALPFDAGTPALPSQSYFCDMQAYAGPQAFYWTIPDDFGDDLFNTRFTVEDNFECTLKVGWILSYAPQMTGSPDMRVYLWDDDGFGFPGSVLDSVDIPFATLDAAGYGYVAADFSAAGWVFADGDEYHYGVTPIGGPGDGIAIISDDADGAFAGEERSSEFWNGAWGTMLNDWGVDYTFDIISERCCEELDFSDCYSQQYAETINLFWRAPHQTYGDSAYAMRFDVGGPETLSSVDIWIYDPGDGSFGDDDVYITVYDDDGGLPGAQIAQDTLPAGSYAAFPTWTNIPFAPLVLEGTFHVAFSSSGTFGNSWEQLLSSNGDDGVGRSSSNWGPGFDFWVSMLSGWGVDYNFIIQANLCRDQFADCQIQDYGAPYFNSVYSLPDANPIIAFAQKFTAAHGGQCQLREATICFYRHPVDVDRPDQYTFNTNINIYADDGGAPGALMHQVTLTPADYAAAGYTGPDFFGAFYITLPFELDVPSPFWIGQESLSPTTEEGIRACLTTIGGSGFNDGLAALFGGNWLDIATIFGWAEDAAMVLSAEVCCVPFTGADCSPPDLWTTQSRDFGRTGASNVPLDDAWCDLTTSWLYETPANTIPFMSPIVHDGRVYISTSATGGDASTIEVLDLISGAHLYSIDDPDLGNSVFNDPTIYNGILYISGGTNFTITGWDISSTTTPATKVMSRTFSGAGTTGPLRFANIIVIDIGGTEVLFAGSEIGRVVAIEAATGLDYGGWSVNPLTLAGGQLIGGSASDGSSLYYTASLLGLDGDVFSVDAASGTINWRLSEEGGLQGAAFHEGESGTLVSEGFTNVSYENGKLFVGSRMTGDKPRDGMYYTLDAATGALINAIATNGFLFSNPIVDINLVYCQTNAQWSPALYGTPMFAASKSTGGVAWSAETPYANEDAGRYLGNGVRSCEPEDGPYPEDIIVNTDEEGAINFWNSVTGEQIFRRRWDFGQDISDGAAATLATDSEGATHVLVTNGFGAVVDLVKGADRPRLEIQGYNLSFPVDFSVDLSVIVTVADALVNTGCADLTFNNVNTSDVSNGSSDPNIVSIDVIRPEILDRSTNLADKLAATGRFFMNAQRINIVNYADELSLVRVRELDQNNERFISRSATSSHPYLNGVTQPISGDVLAAGESLDILIDVNPSEILRGPQTFYIELDTDDPDFFVNAGSASLPSPFPEISVTLVGGCLLDTTYLEFGAGGLNIQVVTNTGRLGTGEDPIPGFLIDDEAGIYYQGTYVFGVSTERIAMSTQDWTGGGGEDNAWKSIQADPNWKDNTCKPALISPPTITLGYIWDATEGEYVEIDGHAVYVSWIDSVQDFSLGAGLAAWNWRNFDAAFNDSLTMGVAANTSTYGVLNVPELANLTVEVFEITERNGNPIPDWKFGSFHDYDIVFILTGIEDTSLIDQSISTAWCTDALLSSDVAWGQIKLPFGCGHEPLKNAYAVDETQGQFSTAGRGNPYWDSAYYYMSLPAGDHGHTVTGSPDQAQHFTLVEHDFAPNETITFAIANFGFNSGLATVADGSALAPTAHLVNKWLGFGRGDVDNDNIITIADIMTVVGIVSGSVLGAIPFEHLADVDADGDVDIDDIDYLVDYYFNNGPCPEGDWILLN